MRLVARSGSGQHERAALASARTASTSAGEPTLCARVIPPQPPESTIVLSTQPRPSPRATANPSTDKLTMDSHCARK